MIKRGLRLGLVLAVLASLAPAAWTQESGAPGETRSAPSSLLPELGDLQVFLDIPPLLQLRWEGSKLKAVHGKSADDYNEALVQVKKILKTNSTSTSRGGNLWFTQAFGEVGSFAIGEGMRMPFGPMVIARVVQKRNAGFMAQFRERKNSESAFQVLTGEGGQISVDLQQIPNDFWFSFQQDKTGEITFRVMYRDLSVDLRAENYRRLIERHFEVVESVLQPLLRRCGVAPPLTRYSNDVQREVWAALQPLQEGRKNEFEKRLEQVNSKQFAERETGTQFLVDHFSEWRDLIHVYSQDSTLPLELRSRLNKVIEKCETERLQEAMAVVQMEKLLDNADYLAWLVRHANETNAETASTPTSGKLELPVHRALSRISELEGRPIQTVDDLAGLGELQPSLDWLQDQPPPKVTESNESIQGPLDKLKTQVARLLPLAERAGALEQETSIWSEWFGHTSVSDWIEQIRQEFDQKQIPRSWFQPGSVYDQKTIGYPQLLFTCLSDASTELYPQENAQMAMQVRQMVAPFSRNRSFGDHGMQGILQLHAPAPRRERRVLLMPGQVGRAPMQEHDLRDEDYFFLELTERIDAKRTFRFFSGPSKQLGITLVIPQQKRVIRIAQFEQHGALRVLIADHRESGAFRITGDSLAQLFERQGGYIRSQILPPLAAIGVNLPDLPQE